MPKIVRKEIKKLPGDLLLIPDIPYGDSTVSVTLRPMMWTDHQLITNHKQALVNGADALDSSYVLISELITKWEEKGKKPKDGISALELATEPLKSSALMIMTNQVIDEFFLTVYEFTLVE